MLKNITSKQRNIIVAVIAIWGIIFIGSGITMNFMDKPITKTKRELKVTQKRVANMKSNEIRLKNMEQEINQPLSVNVKDYLENDVFTWLQQVVDPNQLRWKPFGLPTEETDFVQGLRTIAHAGHSTVKHGIAIRIPASCLKEEICL